jgi:hypothetical protein
MRRSRKLIIQTANGAFDEWPKLDVSYSALNCRAEPVKRMRSLRSSGAAGSIPGSTQGDPVWA